MPNGAEEPVVLAYDGSDAADAALDAAARLFPDRSVLVLSVWQSIAVSARAGLIAIPAEVAEGAAENLDSQAGGLAEELAERGVERLRELGCEASAAVEQSVGSVAQTIDEFASSRQAAVVVMGSRGRSGIKSALLGSVSNAVVHNCGRPVLVVRSESCDQ